MTYVSFSTKPDLNNPKVFIINFYYEELNVIKPHIPAISTFYSLNKINDILNYAKCGLVIPDFFDEPTEYGTVAYVVEMLEGLIEEIKSKNQRGAFVSGSNTKFTNSKISVNKKALNNGKIKPYKLGKNNKPRWV